jgi:hypothetical protein
LVGIRQIRDCWFSRTHRYHGSGSLASSQSLRRGFKVYTFVRMAGDTVKQRGKALRTDQSTGFNSLVNYHFLHRSPGWLIGARDICSFIVSTSAFSVLSGTDFSTSPNFPASLLSILPLVNSILLAFSASSRYTRVAGVGQPQTRAGSQSILELLSYDRQQ